MKKLITYIIKTNEGNTGIVVPSRDNKHILFYKNDSPATVFKLDDTLPEIISYKDISEIMSEKVIYIKDSMLSQYILINDDDDIFAYNMVHFGKYNSNMVIRFKSMPCLEFHTIGDINENVIKIRGNYRVSKNNNNVFEVTTVGDYYLIINKIDKTNNKLIGFSEKTSYYHKALSNAGNAGYEYIVNKV